MTREATGMVSVLAFALALLPGLAFAGGNPAVSVDATPEQAPAVRTDVWYSTGGAYNAIPDVGGWNTEFGVYFVATVQNAWGQDLQLLELGVPCVGPATGEFGWGVWTGVGGEVPPAADPSTADYHGSFVPVFTDPHDPPSPDLWYNYIDVAAWEIIIPLGTYFSFGYEVTGLGGLIDYNGGQTWSWWQEAWAGLDGFGSGYTAVMQFGANYAGPIATEPTTWGGIKSVLR